MPGNRERMAPRGCTRLSKALYDGNDADQQTKHARQRTGAPLCSRLLLMAHTDSSRSAGEALPPSSKPIEQATLIGTLMHLWPYIWPGDRVDLKMRVVWSMVLLLVAKLATLTVPFTFKWAIDALTGADTAPVQASNWPLWLIASPLIMTVSYGALRVLMAVFTQWRDGIFARVAMHAVRKLALIHISEPTRRTPISYAVF